VNDVIDTAGDLLKTELVPIGSNNMRSEDHCSGRNVSTKSTQ